MKPIPKRLLIHSAQLMEVRQDIWQSETLQHIADLRHIRIEPSSKLATDKQNRQIALSAVLFFDCRSSTPKRITFSHGQKIIWDGAEYRIEIIEAIYDDRRLHHYELGLV